MTETQNQDVRPFAISTTVPTANSKAAVLAMGPATYGILCKCHGSVLPPVGAYFDGVYVKIGRGGTTYTRQQVVAAPDAYISSGELYPGGVTQVPADWNLDNRLTADCGPAGAEKPNTLYVVSRLLSYNPANPSNPYSEVLELSETPFKGKAVSTCGTAVAGETTMAESGAAVSPASAPGSVSGAPAAPKNSDGEWLLYSGLTASNPFFGNRLMRNGLPLRARLIAVAAADVDWSYDQSPVGIGRKYIRRAVGDLAFEPFRPSPWRFASLSANGIVVWQNKLGLPEYAVSSECRQQPNLIHLDPSEDILVQVNYFAFAQNSLSGQFDLWVKVID